MKHLSNKYFSIILFSVLLFSCKDNPVESTQEPEYKEYVASVTQIGLYNPVDTVMVCTLPTRPTWTRFAAGQYILHIDGGFPIDKTFIQITNGYFFGLPGYVTFTTLESGDLMIYTFDSSKKYSDNILCITMFSINIYR